MRISIRRPRPDSRPVATGNRPARARQIDDRLRAAREEAWAELNRPRYL